MHFGDLCAAIGYGIDRSLFHILLVLFGKLVVCGAYLHLCHLCVHRRVAEFLHHFGIESALVHIHTARNGHGISEGLHIGRTSKFTEQTDFQAFVSVKCIDIAFCLWLRLNPLALTEHLAPVFHKVCEIGHHIVQHFQVVFGKAFFAFGEGFQHIRDALNIQARTVGVNIFEDASFYSVGSVPLPQVSEDLARSRYIQVSSELDSRQLLNGVLENLAVVLGGVCESSEFQILHFLGFAHKQTEQAIPAFDLVVFRFPVFRPLGVIADLIFNHTGEFRLFALGFVCVHDLVLNALYHAGDLGIGHIPVRGDPFVFRFRQRPLVERIYFEERVNRVHLFQILHSRHFARYIDHKHIHRRSLAGNDAACACDLVSALVAPPAEDLLQALFVAHMADLGHIFLGEGKFTDTCAEI